MTLEESAYLDSLQQRFDTMLVSGLERVSQEVTQLTRLRTFDALRQVVIYPLRCEQASRASSQQ